MKLLSNLDNLKLKIAWNMDKIIGKRNGSGNQRFSVSSTFFTHFIYNANEKDFSGVCVENAIWEPTHGKQRKWHAMLKWYWSTIVLALSEWWNWKRTGKWTRKQIGFVFIETNNCALQKCLCLTTRHFILAGYNSGPSVDRETISDGHFYP